MLWIPAARTSATTGLELNLKMNLLVENVTNVTGGRLCCRLLTLVGCRVSLRVNLKMAVMQLADANGDLVAVEPNCDVTNLCVSRRNRDNEPVSELSAKTVAWHKPLKLGEKSLGEAVMFWR